MLAFISNGVLTQYPIGLQDLKQAYSNTSFTLPLVASELADFDVVEVAATDQPVFDPRTQRIEESSPALVDGEWRQQWSVISLTVEEIQAIEDAQAESVRAERNRNLAECDWTQLSDAPVDAAVWATYRQALRDVPSQPGFPHNVTWPTEPTT